MLVRAWFSLRLILLLVIVIARPSDARAERAASTLLLPKETILYGRIADVPTFVERMRQTGGGRMFSDPQLKPLVEHLYGKAREEVDQAKEKLGLGLDDLLKIPQGEIAIAMVPVKGQVPAIIAIIDTGNNVANAKKLLEVLEREAQGLNRREEQIAGQTVVIFQLPDDQQLALFERQGTYVFCTNPAIVEELIKNWSGREKDTLNDNPRYAAIMTACHAKDQEPQLVFFIEPIQIAKLYAAGDISAAIALNILPALGLDGLQALGGSLAFDLKEFDMLLHAHALLDNPRNGVLDALQLGEGDLKPQPWVPANVASYTTFYWDFASTFDKVEKIVDSFQGAGTTSDGVKKNISNNLGVDFVTELLPVLSGRVTILSRMPKQDQGVNLPEVNTQAADGDVNAEVRLGMQFGRGADQLWAIEVKDEKQGQALLDKILEKPEFGNNIEKKSWAGHTYYAVKMPEFNGRRRGGPMPEPCFAISRDCLLIADHLPLLQDSLGSREEKDSLAAELDFKLMTSKILRENGSGKVGLLTFQRPQEVLRYIWDIAVQEQTKQRLAEAGENNRFVATLGNALKEHPLPPFSALEKYFAPTGGILTNQENGFHYLSFTLKRKIE